MKTRKRITTNIEKLILKEVRRQVRIQLQDVKFESAIKASLDKWLERNVNGSTFKVAAENAISEIMVDMMNYYSRTVS